LVGRPKALPSGATSVALTKPGSAPKGIVVGTNNDTVYCLPVGGGTPLWKTPLPGDIWKVATFPDVDEDGSEDVVLACGADAGYLLSGATGAILFSHAVSMGGV